MDFICKKGLTLNGKRYAKGDTIPDGEVLESRIRALKSSGYIGDVDSKEAPAEKKQSVLHSDVAEQKAPKKTAKTGSKQPETPKGNVDTNSEAKDAPQGVSEAVKDDKAEATE